MRPLSVVVPARVFDEYGSRSPTRDREPRPATAQPGRSTRRAAGACRAPAGPGRPSSLHTRCSQACGSAPTPHRATTDAPGPGTGERLTTRRSQRAPITRRDNGPIAAQASRLGAQPLRDDVRSGTSQERGSLSTGATGRLSTGLDAPGPLNPRRWSPPTIHTSGSYARSISPGKCGATLFGRRGTSMFQAVGDAATKA